MAAAGRARQTRGRQKIPMRLIQNQDDLYASFSKRRVGLFKKASELSTLCGADIGVIVFSPTDNPFSFFSPTMDSVIDRHVNPDRPFRQAARAVDSHTRARIEALNRRLDEVAEQKRELKEYDGRLEEADRARESVWWETTAVDGLDKEQVAEWTAWFKSFKARLESKMAELQNGSAAGPPAPTSYFGGGGGVEQYVFNPPPSPPPLPPPQDLFYGDGGGNSHLFTSEYECYTNHDSGVLPAPPYVGPAGETELLCFPNYENATIGGEDKEEEGGATSNHKVV